MNSFLQMLGNGFNALTGTAAKVYSSSLQAQAVKNQYSLQEQQLAYQAAQQRQQAAQTAAQAAQQQTTGNILLYGSLAAGLVMLWYVVSRVTRRK